MSCTASSTVDSGRRIILLDIENQVGGGRCGDDRLRLTIDGFETAVDAKSDDLIFVAATPQLAYSYGLLRPKPSVRCAYGQDGADLRLITDVPIDYVCDRADELIIGSGDHIFIDHAIAARDRGLRVRIVGPKFAIHHVYWQHDFEIIQLASIKEMRQACLALGA